LMVPWEVTIVPSFLLFRALGWLDTLTPLIVPQWFGGGPFFIFLNSPEKFTISLGMRYFQTIPMEAGKPKDHLLMAGTIIMIVPCVLLFFFAQRYFVRGIVLSGLKG
jgi:ABC-type glycerol-3-phosphate transport system permease component